MRRRLVALGDSFSCGVGVGVEVPLDETWVGQLATLLNADLELLASPGMASSEVLRDQVPAALTLSGDVATLLVGLNDIVRASFDPAATHANVRAIVAELRRAYPVVLVARLHNAVAQLPLPRRVREHYAERIEQVNAAIDDAVATHPGAVLVRLDHLPGLHTRGAWAVDRIHPTPYGHHAIASAALAALPDTETFGLGQPVASPHTPPSRLEEIRWFVAFGAPWLVGRLPKVVFGRQPGREHADTGPRRELRGVGEPGTGRRIAGREQVVHH